MARKSKISRRTVDAAAALQKAWGMLQRLIDGLPDAAIVPMDVTGRSSKAGHFLENCWRTRTGRGGHEIAISPILFTNAEQLLETLTHEAVHAVLFEEDPESTEHSGGCSLTDHHYHMSIFRDRCIEVGLQCEMLNRRYGFTHTSWPAAGVPDQYREVLALLKKEMPLGAETGPIRPPRRSNPMIQMYCECRPPRIIYLPRNTALGPGIICEKCAFRFSLLERPSRTPIGLGERITPPPV